jgi:hypothetical protein
METKPSKGMKVKVNAQREAIFGDESVSVQRVVMNNGNNAGVMTGRTLVGFVEIEGNDGHKHWFPIEDLTGEQGERFVEEEIPVDMDEGDAEEPE